MDMVLAKENMTEKNKIWQEAIEALIDPTYGMDEEESAAYMGRIMSKLKSGNSLLTPPMALSITSCASSFDLQFLSLFFNASFWYFTRNAVV